jgi:hypothetical protein
MFIWKPPSPLTDHTRSSGLTSFTPTAMGSAQPMVPAPPEVNQLLTVWKL